MGLDDQYQYWLAGTLHGLPEVTALTARAKDKENNSPTNFTMGRWPGHIWRCMAQRRGEQSGEQSGEVEEIMLQH